MSIEFKINFKGCEFEDLKRRITDVRFPSFLCNSDWELGTPTEALQAVLEQWNSYDWKPQQDYLNSFPQFICQIGDVNLHFFHIKAVNLDAPTILMAHGWPDSFLRYSKTFPLLRDFNLVVPSIPGFGFSTLPKKGWINNADTAELLHTLMKDILGYNRYVVTGGDMGRGVLLYLAANHSEEVVGLHLTDVGVAGSIMTASDDSLSPDYLDYKRSMLRWMRYDGAYINIQGSKPYSLGYGLSDSPAAMAGWLLEKFHDWSDWERFTMNDLLNNLTLYWMTRCSSSSITAYHGNSFSLPPLGKVNQPVAIARFPHDILPVPRRWIEENYNVVQFNEMPYGGHFTAMEAPEPFANDIINFVNHLNQ